MKSRWEEFVLPFAVDVDWVEEVYEDLVRWYGENGRFYHNLHHIEAVLNHVQPFLDESENLVALQFAVWFHDVVYDPQRRDNEAQSVLYARERLARVGMPEVDIQMVEHLIMLTEKHKTAVSDKDGHILLDADLAILASEPTEYDVYAQAIRQEYAHVPDDAYRVGRSAVLRRLGERPFLYYLPEHHNWESRARENILRELTLLV